MSKEDLPWTAVCVIIAIWLMCGCAGGGYAPAPYYANYTPLYIPPVQVYPQYNPLTSPVFNPVPITSENPFGVRR